MIKTTAFIYQNFMNDWFFGGETPFWLDERTILWIGRKLTRRKQGKLLLPGEKRKGVRNRRPFKKKIFRLAITCLHGPKRPQRPGLFRSGIVLRLRREHFCQDLLPIGIFRSKNRRPGTNTGIPISHIFQPTGDSLFRKSHVPASYSVAVRRHISENRFSRLPQTIPPTGQAPNPAFS